MRLLIKTDQSAYPEQFSVSYLAIRNDDLWLVRFEWYKTLQQALCVFYFIQNCIILPASAMKMKLCE